MLRLKRNARSSPIVMSAGLTGACCATIRFASIDRTPIVKLSTSRAALPLLAVLVFTGNAWAQVEESRWASTVKLSHEVASGTYGTATRSTTQTTGATLSWEGEAFAFDIDAPYLVRSGPSRLVNIGGRRQALAPNGTQDAKGQGDVNIGATRYLLNQENAGVDLDLGAALKLPTASADKGLGTGKTDMSLQATLAKSYGDFASSATVGYTFVGKPAAQNFRNTPFGSIDLSYRLGSQTRVGLTYSASSSVTSGLSGPRDLLVYADHQLTKNFRAEVFMGKGYSTQSADHTFGLAVTVSL